MLIYELGTHVIGRIADSPKFIKLSCFGKIIKNYNAHQFTVLINPKILILTPTILRKNI